MEPKRIYFDNAATSFPKPEAVYARMDRFLREEAANPGRSGHRLAVDAEVAIGKARSSLAKLFGIRDPQRLIFALNCTDALNIAMKGFLKEGDHVISSVLEHNSVNRPLNALEKAGTIRVTRVIPDAQGFLDPASVKKAFEARTRLIAVTHASNVIGTVQPIRELGKIAHEAGAFLLVDAAQTAGCFPINAAEDHIDLLAFPGHKALFGPMGTGGLYVSENVKLAAWREGGTGGDSKSPLQPEEMPHALEGGTPNAAGIVGLGEGAEFVLKEGMDRIRRHEIALIQRLRLGLEKIKGLKLYGSADAMRSVPAVAFNIEGLDPQEAGAVLDQHFGVAARSGLHCAPLTHEFLGTSPHGCIRLSPGYFNTAEETDRVIEAVQTIQKEFSAK